MKAKRWPIKKGIRQLADASLSSHKPTIKNIFQGFTLLYNNANRIISRIKLLLFCLIPPCVSKKITTRVAVAFIG